MRPLDNCSISDPGTMEFRPVTACMGDTPPLFEVLFLTAKAEDDSPTHLSHANKAQALKTIFISINLTIAPCLSACPRRHLAPSGTTSCTTAKRSFVTSTEPANSAPPSVTSTSGGPNTEYHMSCRKPRGRR